MGDLVPFGDLAARLGGAARAVALLDRVRGQVTEDPLGHPIVSEDAARAAIDADELEQRTERELADAYRRWSGERAERRRAARRAAYSEVIERRLAAERNQRRRIWSGEAEGPRITGPVLADGFDTTAARASASAAVAAFDAKEPDPGFAEWRESREGKRAAKAARQRVLA